MEKEIDIKRVQNRLLEMGAAITDILEKHNIPYFIIYGTLLGAVRHKGFIPWDDDFDLYLFDDTYEKGIGFLRTELPKDMFVEDATSEPLFFHAWAHIKDLGSKTFCEEFPQDSFYRHNGISVDLYRIKEMEECCLSDYLNEENRKYIERRKKLGLISEKEYEIRISALMESERAASNSPIQSKRKIYGTISMYKCKFFESTDLFPLRKYEFANHYFYGPHNAHNILKAIYGDYMILPPIEKRRSHYSKVEFL